MAIPVRIVLIDTTHPGNIGAVARAMKNMGVHDLALVRPKVFPSEEATARSAGADDVLAAARVVGTLEEAIADCGLVTGTTSRSRMHYFNVLDARVAAEKVVAAASVERPAAILFGSEKYGLTNEELTRCNWLIRIPANPDYQSLNVAMAVQLLCYELFTTGMGGGRVAQPPRETPPANAGDLERLYGHLEEVLKEVGFVDRTQAGSHLINRFRRLFGRVELDQNEVNILRGFLTAIQGKRRVAGSKSGGDATRSQQGEL